MKQRTISGTPWRIGYGDRKKECDPRRNKKNCIYYSMDNHCCYYASNCIGSAHCVKYQKRKNKININVRNLIEEEEIINLKQKNLSCKNPSNNKVINKKKKYLTHKYFDNNKRNKNFNKRKDKLISLSKINNHVNIIMVPADKKYNALTEYIFRVIIRNYVFILKYKRIYYYFIPSSLIVTIKEILGKDYSKNIKKIVEIFNMSINVEKDHKIIFNFKNFLNNL